jgi:hypothetical protein
MNTPLAIAHPVTATDTPRNKPERTSWAEPSLLACTPSGSAATISLEVSGTYGLRRALWRLRKSLQPQA